MSLLLSCRELAKSFSAIQLFEDVTFSLHEGAHVGIIGPNGVGKSTLLRILAGLETPDSGEVVTRKSVKLAYVPQTTAFTKEANDTVYEVVRAGAIAASVHADALESVVHTSLGRTGFEDSDAKVGTLSGGWKKRLSMARALAEEPDIMLLDEPTNHLDTHGVLWLETLLGSADFTWALISHDRYFLERTAARVVELNPVYPEMLFEVEGGYHRFLEKKQEFIESRRNYRDALAGKVRRETEWLRRSPKARTTKAKYRIDAAERLIGELDKVKTSMKETRAKIDFSASDRKTKKLVEIKGIHKTLGDRVIVSGLDLILSPGRAVGLLGVNGTGKTTLLKLFGGDLEPDKGSVRHAPDLKVVYFDQNREQLDPTLTLQRALSETGDSVIYRGQSVHVITWAKRFQFEVDQLPTLVKDLSGGEQARLLIAQLMLQPADILLLDEPTNDLDIQTLEILEESLADFPGALVLVTHDRYMLSRVCGGFVGLDGKGDASLFADYDQWEKTLTQPAKPKAKEKKATGARVNHDTRKRLSYMEQREFDAMEETIMLAEEALEEAKVKAEDPAIQSNGAALTESYAALDAAQKEVERLYARWSELEQKQE